MIKIICTCLYTCIPLFKTLPTLLQRQGLVTCTFLYNLLYSTFSIVLPKGQESMFKIIGRARKIIFGYF